MARMAMRDAWWLLGSCLVVLAGCSKQDEAAPAEVDDDELRDALEARFDEAAEDGFEGVALVIVDGETVFERGYGLADRQSETENTLTTAFDFGSVMKDLTAAAIFKLEDQGALEAQDTLDAFFDDVPEDKAAITLLQLLQHSAGLDEYHDTEGDFEALTREEARTAIFAQELLFDPGSDEAYSNSGFTLLADVIEEASGRAFTQYVREELLEPARMRSSGFYGDQVWERVETAIGYDDLMFGDNDPASWPLTWALVGNGGLVATAGDVARWLSAVRDGRVLSEAAFARYEAEYLALGELELEGHAVYAFAGAGDFGLGGVAVDCPELDAQIVIATNTATVFDIEGLASELAMLVLAEP
jgi:CubicO group peptidase (beta-lactamase class C family)